MPVKPENYSAQLFNTENVLCDEGLWNFINFIARGNFTEDKTEVGVSGQQKWYYNYYE